LLIVVCQSCFVSTGYWCRFQGLLWASLGGGQEGPYQRGCQVIIRIALPWSIVGSILEECHAPCKLNISYVDFEKELVHRFHYKRLVCGPYPTLQFFSGIKCCWSGSPIQSLFLCSFYILCCTCSRAQYS
jgi:hypothetical protein